ncbi:uncharacterized protein DUF3798 [Hydrogenoanaerobacterium saccharovorans]|uniref:DUF3798 domain-containing protein n=1 Tax=Hydrogenoanaerobacterium saccharovorans TaxID=474960 RepID=A0A1H7YZS9_9FIRM|nr:DUF3798 domain-containing protein [Hydrogenoanaerobacterium saccharovorans]RPF48949.1 uncharacterized protein DUF3798 [Hydrogenoanaerobacterium saccharovorans]SEM50747.1 Protein of unknown function [Hydrogenoanaerobacterium saccharovorans]
MKKLLALVLALTMVLSLAACGSKPATETPEGSKPAEGGAAPANFKVAIITGTVSQGEEEFRAAEQMKAAYPEMVVTATYPDNFAKEQETTISNVLNLVSDESVKALVFLQAVPGASAAIAKAKELKPDLLVIAGVTGEDPAVISPAADMVLNADELGMGKSIMEQAKALGAKTFVHYSFPRHMSVALLSGRRDLLKKTAEELGIQFVEATAPDPLGDSGVPGAQQFILEDVPKMIEKYGKETAFFATNCAMQEPLIKTILAGGAIFPQQCCPSPYHGYPGALGIAIPDDKAGDVDFILQETTKKITEKGNPGRMSTWTVPINMLFVKAGVEYAKQYLEGTITEKADMEAMKKICSDLAGGPVTMTKLTENGVDYNNFFTLLGSYYTYGEAK